MFLNCCGLFQYIIYNRYRCFFCTTVAFFNTLKPHPQPLPVGEGSEYPHFLLENRAQRPCSTMIGLANLSRTVVSVPRPPTTKLFESILLFGGAGGWGTETTVLLWFARLFTPLSDGEGLGVGPFLHKYTEMKSCRERHQITIWKHGFQAAKPRVSGRETKGFRV